MSVAILGTEAQTLVDLRKVKIPPMDVCSVLSGARIVTARCEGDGLAAKLWEFEDLAARGCAKISAVPSNRSPARARYRAGRWPQCAGVGRCDPGAAQVPRLSAP